MGHICCEKWWNTLVLIQPKSEVYEKWDLSDRFHHILQCQWMYTKKKVNIYQRLLTKSSDDWKVFKGMNPINRNASMVLKCTFSYYCPVSGRILRVRANPAELVLYFSLSSPHDLLYGTETLGGLRRWKRRIWFVMLCLSAWHCCHHFNVTGQTKPTKPSPLLYSPAAAGLYNHFHFCILEKCKLSSILNSHISPMCYQEGN